MLRKLNCSTELANDGREALKKFQSKKYDIILMDCQMPNMDGFEATAKIRELEAKQGDYTPIIVVTANAIEGDRDKCFASGMDDYLSKPIQIEKLEQKLIQWLQSKTISSSQNLC